MSRYCCGKQVSSKFCTSCGKAQVIGLEPVNPPASSKPGVTVVSKGTSEFRAPPSGRNSALDYAGKRGEDEIVRIREQRAEEDKKKNEQMAQEMAWRQAYQ